MRKIYTPQNSAQSIFVAPFFSKRPRKIFRTSQCLTVPHLGCIIGKYINIGPRKGLTEHCLPIESPVLQFTTAARLYLHSSWSKSCTVIEWLKGARIKMTHALSSAMILLEYLLP